MLGMKVKVPASRPFRGNSEMDIPRKTCRFISGEFSIEREHVQRNTFWYDLEEVCETSQPHLTFILPICLNRIPPPRVGSVRGPVYSDYLWFDRSSGLVDLDLSPSWDPKKKTQNLQMEWKCGQLPVTVVQLNGIYIYIPLYVNIYIYCRNTFYTIILLVFNCHVKRVYHGTIKMVIVPPGPNFPPASGGHWRFQPSYKGLAIDQCWNRIFCRCQKKCGDFLTLLYCYTYYPPWN